MISFYRRIRQNFISAGKTGKYLKYATGEILLVVIGILIALQLNTASQQKTNRKHVESILKSVFFNLESDMSNPVIRYIQFSEFKDSLNNLVLNNSLSYTDYVSSGQGSRSLSRLLSYEFEPFQFENQAYERLMANIEIIPDEYMSIVKMLQDVYSKEVPVVNEVAVEAKNFVDEIEDKYQTTYDWYSNTDSLHFRQKVDYMLNNPKYLNDVKRHQAIINHLLAHLNTIKRNISIAYSKIHHQLMFDEAFSEIMEQFYFPTEIELKAYSGVYEGVDNTSFKIELISKEYYLTTASSRGGLKLIKAGVDRFIMPSDPQVNYFQFVRDEQGKVSSLNTFRIGENSDATSNQFQKVK